MSKKNKKNAALSGGKGKGVLRVVGMCLRQLLILGLLVLTFGLLWGVKNYGNIGLDEIIFTLNMPLAGTSDSLVNSYLLTGLLPAVLLFAAETLFINLPFKKIYSLVLDYNNSRKNKTAQFRLQLFPFKPHWVIFTAILVVWLALLVFKADASFGLFSYVKNQFDRTQIYDVEYVDPTAVELEFPEEKRNLIQIYLESAETTNQDFANGGLFDTNYIPEMTQLAKDNISFSQSELLEGAAVAPACGWTIAGLVAQTSGLPLKLFTYDGTSGGADNSMGRYASFMPGATSLGDILEEQGYTNYFMCGSDAYFGGRSSYFTKHGNYTIWDYDSAIEEGKIPSDYHEWWGFEDQKLYAYAKEKLLELADSGEPFNFTMLTADTHHVNGYVCSLCEDEYDEQYGNVWACASRQVNEFVEWLQQQDFYENTTIVITGDHCSMDPYFYSDFTDMDGIVYGKHYGYTTRKVYNCIINAAIDPINEKNRLFTTLDMFPTTLAAMGVQIEGNRLGLGTNLFSDTETLSEQYGYDYLYEELNKTSTFYNNKILYP